MVVLVLFAAGCATRQGEDRLLSFKYPRRGATYEVGVYVIAPGDSVASICQKFHILIPDFMAMNPGLDPRILRIGRTVRIYEREPMHKMTPNTALEPTPTAP